MKQLRKATWDLVYWTFLFTLATGGFASLELNTFRVAMILVFGVLTVVAYRKLKAALEAVEGMVCDESTRDEPHGAESGAEGV